MISRVRRVIRRWIQPDPQVVVEPFRQVVEQRKVVGFGRTARFRQVACNLESESVRVAEALDVLETPDARILFLFRLEDDPVVKDPQDSHGAAQGTQMLRPYL